MSTRDFPPRPQGAQPDSVPYQNWLDALGQRQNIDLLQELTSVASGDEIAIFDASETGQNKTKKITVANLLAGTTGLSLPQGRLTLTTAVPVLTSEVANATTIYYAPYQGDSVPIYNGTEFEPQTFTELSLALDSDSGHTGYHQSGKNFDLFIVNDAGTLRLASGPAWTSDTARDEAITRVAGILVNDTSMTVRFGSASGNNLTIDANKATYVGTFRASANGQTTWEIGGTAAGGDPIRFFLWNYYNRAVSCGSCRDSTNTWSYNTATWRSSNNSTSMRASFVIGVSEDCVDVSYIQTIAISTNQASPSVSLAVDSTSTPTAPMMYGSGPAGTNLSACVTLKNTVSAGFHYVQCLEYANPATSGYTAYGDAGVSFIQNGLNFSGLF